MVARLRIIVAGMVGQYPVGGVAWDYLQYVMGLQRLGHDVFYHEDTWCWPYHPREKTITENPDYSVAFLKGFFETYAPELASQWHYLHLHEGSYGMSRRAFDEVARTADLFVNVSGASFFPDTLSPDCLKLFIGSDPGYHQIGLTYRPAWSENVDRWCAGVLAHDRHFTYGENVGASDCEVPTAGLRWQKTRMPVVLDLWKNVSLPAPAAGAWSTVMTWNVFRGKLEYRGIEYHGKAAEFGKIIDLPRRLKLPFRVALGGTEAPLPELTRQGWMAEDGPAVTLRAEAYRDFIAESRGEISVAKNVYVALRTGWFSCRSACYLAAGRPVVVQDTGFSHFIPSGRGLHAFTNSEEAEEAILAVERDYSREVVAARQLAQTHFDSRRVLSRLVEDAISGPCETGSG